MNLRLLALVIAMVCPARLPLCYSEIAVDRAQALSDIDARMKEIRTQIRIYENRALYTDREAQRLMTLDYYAYRCYITERNRDLDAAQTLKKELKDLEQQRQAIAELKDEL